MRRAAHAIVNGTTKSCKSCSRTQLHKNNFSLSYYNKIVRRAKFIKVDIDVSPDYLYELYLKQNKKCNLSGLDISFKTKWSDPNQTASLDRIDSSKGYIENNVQWVHKDINFMKHTLSQEEFIKLCKAVASKCG